MSQSKKTTASRMSDIALTKEHGLCGDDPNCPDKTRRLRLKDELVRRAASSPTGHAATYARKRGWISDPTVQPHDDSYATA
jgi:hypothetical protein